MSDILSKIALYKRDEVEKKRTHKSINQLKQDIANVSDPRGFCNALISHKKPKNLSLIAEIKKASPSKGLIRADFEPIELAKAYQQGGAACLSILTDTPSFMGNDADFVAARSSVTLPCIRKDFIVDTWQVYESRSLGADAILVIMAMIDDSLASDLVQIAHDLGMDALIEVHTLEETKRAIKLNSKLIGINNRNLKTFNVDINVTKELSQYITAEHVLVTESGVFTKSDVEFLESCGAKAMLVGESLMRQDNVLLATQALLGF